MSGEFSENIQAFVAKTQVKADQALRAISLELWSRVILRSPVGNPELWAANKVAVEGRKAAVAAAQVAGKRISRKRLEREHPLIIGEGYVGGRFRGNWVVTFESPATETVDVVDPSGAKTIAAGAVALKSAHIGLAVFMVNNLPYAQRIEEGWSKQSPAGVVKVTVADFAGIVSDVADRVAAEDEG